MRGAGCTFNDIVDTDIDTKVERTRLAADPVGPGDEAAGGACSWCSSRCSGSLILMQFNG